MMLRNLMGVSRGPFEFNLTGSDLRSAAIAAGWNGTSEVIATILAGVKIQRLSIYGFFPNGGTLISKGGIYGDAGKGGFGGYTGGGGMYPMGGEAGGAALSVGVPFKIDNTNGGIYGGGGGGGGGGGTTTTTGGEKSGGNGGGGADASFSARPGSPGLGGGDGYGGNGGAGGGFGQPGIRGNNGIYIPTSTQIIGAPGGAAGNAVVGNSNINWLGLGTRVGVIS